MKTYGVKETNPLTEEQREELAHVDHSRKVYWNDPELKCIVRLRMLSDPGFPYWDISYCYGRLHDGTLVRVSLPQTTLIPKRNWKGCLITLAKRDGVYLKGLGLFNTDVISMLV